MSCLTTLRPYVHMFVLWFSGDVTCKYEAVRQGHNNAIFLIKKKDFEGHTHAQVYIFACAYVGG